MNDANVFLLGASKGEEKGLFKGQNREIALPEAMQMKNTEKPITCLHLFSLSFCCERQPCNSNERCMRRHFAKLVSYAGQQSFSKTDRYNIWTNIYQCCLLYFYLIWSNNHDIMPGDRDYFWFVLRNSEEHNNNDWSFINVKYYHLPRLNT